MVLKKTDWWQWRRKYTTLSMIITLRDRSWARSLSSRTPLSSIFMGSPSLLGDVFISMGSLAASSLTRSAYLSVFRECSHELMPGLIIAICNSTDCDHSISLCQCLEADRNYTRFRGTLISTSGHTHTQQNRDDSQRNEWIINGSINWSITYKFLLHGAMFWKREFHLRLQVNMSVNIRHGFFLLLFIYSMPRYI